MIEHRKVSDENQIQLYLHCALCLAEWKAGKAKGHSPSSYSSIEVGWTELGLQVWCKRHDCNMCHIDFEGAQHPANTERRLDG
ncbi:MAG: hypothetical protein E4G89_00320 [Methanothrix sp.]|nr:MAG: hypothetical protein E4G89_00320 [Methanothrix sp.]